MYLYWPLSCLKVHERAPLSTLILPLDPLNGFQPAQRFGGSSLWLVHHISESDQKFKGVG